MSLEVRSPASPTYRHRRKRPTHSTAAIVMWCLLITLTVGLGIGAYLLLPRLVATRRSAHNASISGYLDGVDQLRREVQDYYGKPLRDADLESRFSAAHEFVARRDFFGAAVELEHLTDQVAVPMIFDDLGLLYAQVNDNAHALDAFREALVRDPDYGPALAGVRQTNVGTAAPLTGEVESNNTVLTANLVPVDSRIDAEISPPGDVDCFRFIAPRAPRDILRIEVTNPSRILGLTLQTFDATRKMTDFGGNPGQPDASLVRQLAPPPNSNFYLQVSGVDGSTGKYVVLVRPLKAYDTYEPDDDFDTAHQITSGETVSANIMDAEDNDFYWFEKPEPGTVHLVVQRESNDLIPALSTFAPDRKNVDFSVTSGRTAGLIEYSMPVRAHEKYWIQVWGLERTAGAYSLRLR